MTYDEPLDNLQPCPNCGDLPDLRRWKERGEQWAALFHCEHETSAFRYVGRFGLDVVADDWNERCIMEEWQMAPEAKRIAA